MNVLAAQPTGYVPIEIKKGRLCAPSLPNRLLLPLIVVSTLCHLFLFQIAAKLNLATIPAETRIDYVDLAALPGAITASKTLQQQADTTVETSAKNNRTSTSSSFAATEAGSPEQTAGSAEVRPPQNTMPVDTAVSAQSQRQESWAVPVSTIQPQLLQQLALRYTREVWRVTSQLATTGSDLSGRHVIPIVQDDYRPAESEDTTQQHKSSLVASLPRPLPGQTALEIIVTGSGRTAQISIYPHFETPPP